MFESHPDSDRALTEGLRNLPSPEPSPDFNSRVIEGLRKPEPWWQVVLPRIRPLISGAACSLILTVVIARWALNAPESRAQVHPAAEHSTVALEEALDRPDLRAGTLARLSIDRKDVPPIPVSPPAVPKHPRGQSRRFQPNTTA